MQLRIALVHRRIVIVGIHVETPASGQIRFVRPRRLRWAPVHDRPGLVRNRVDYRHVDGAVRLVIMVEILLPGRVSGQRLHASGLWAACW